MLEIRRVNFLIIFMNILGLFEMFLYWTSGERTHTLVIIDEGDGSGD